MWKRGGLPEEKRGPPPLRINPSSWRKWAVIDEETRYRKHPRTRDPRIV